MVDVHGLPIDFVLTGGEAHEATVAPELTAQLPRADAIVADKGYDGARLCDQTKGQTSRPVNPRKRNSIKDNADLDRGLYRYRHLVKNAFAQLKYYRAIATRFDKLKKHYEGAIAMVCAVLWLLM